MYLQEERKRVLQIWQFWGPNWKLKYLKKFWTGIVLVLMLTFASIFIDQADWGKQVTEKWFKVQH